MSDVTTTLDSWSTTPGSNQPQGSTVIGSGLDENLRQMQATTRYLASPNSIASAATTDLSTVNDTFITVSGTTTITAFGTLTSGIYKWLIFSGALTLTHNGTSLILPDAVNITTAAGDVALMLSLGSGNWRCLNINSRASAAAFTTGDVKLTIKTVADAAWVLMNDGTIGNAASGGTTRANADTVALFTLLYNNTADADCAVSGGRGASAAADYAANKTIALPKALGRALATYGAGSGLTSRAMAKILGEETHVLTTAEMPAHVHTLPRSNNAGADTGNVSQGGGANIAAINSGSTGGDGAHNTMQPTVFLNVMIKL